MDLVRHDFSISRVGCGEAEVLLRTGLGTPARAPLPHWLWRREAGRCGPCGPCPSGSPSPAARCPQARRPGPHCPALLPGLGLQNSHLLFSFRCVGLGSFFVCFVLVGFCFCFCFLLFISFLLCFNCEIYRAESHTCFLKFTVISLLVFWILKNPAPQTIVFIPRGGAGR